MQTFPNRALTATECAMYKLTPTTLMGSVVELRHTDLHYRYTWRVDRGDNPDQRGLLDRVRVDRDEGYEVLHFINHFCRKLRISVSRHGSLIEELLKTAPSNMVMRDQLQNWVWTQVTLRARGGLLGAA